MQLLNFIPSDYVKQKMARQANLLCGILGGVVVLALAVVFVLIGLAEDGLQDEEQAVDGAVAAAAKDIARWNALEDQRKALMTRAERAARLLDPLPRSRIAAELVGLLPQKVALSEFSVDEMTVRSIENTADAKTAPKTRRGGRSAAPAEVRETTETRLRLLGVAPTDVEVAKLIAALSNSPYFDQVELSYSEDLVRNEHVLRRFEVLFRLSDNACRLGLQASPKEKKL